MYTQRRIAVLADSMLWVLVRIVDNEFGNVDKHHVVTRSNVVTWTNGTQMYVGEQHVYQHHQVRKYLHKNTILFDL